MPSSRDRPGKPAKSRAPEAVRALPTDELHLPMPSKTDPLGVALDSPPLPLSDTDFAHLTTLIQDRTGIYLHPGKKPLLAARLSERMRALGLVSYADYVRHVLASGPAELARMMDAVCTNETRFFRDAEQLTHIERSVLPSWLVHASRTRQERRVRVWSAGCSTGEEAFSIAMLLLSRLTSELFSIEVWGTDISGAALERARAARWPANRMEEIPEPYRQRYFEEDARTGEWVPSTDLRNVVRFQRLNLQDVYPATGRFDLIFCRNVLIYFDPDTRAAVIRKLAERLGPKGLLCLGMTESPLAARDPALALHSVGPAIYTRNRQEVAPREER